MADMRVSLTLTADGSALVGELRLARAELAQLHSAANDAGAGLRVVGGDGTVAGVTQTRRAVTGLTGDMAATTTQAAGAQTAARGLSTDMARVGSAAASTGAGVAGASARLRTLGVAANDAGGGLDAAAAAAGRHGAALGGAGEAAGAAFGAIRALTGGVGGLVTTVMSLGATQLVEWLVPVRIEAEATERRLTALTGGGAALADAQRWLSVTANRLGADLKGLTESYAGLLPMQKAGLLSTQQARDLTEGLRAAQLRYGASAESMANVSYGLGQALASPVLHLEELAQVTEPLPGLLLDLDKAAGLPAGGFRKLADQGKVTASMFRDTLLKALKGYAADAAAAAKGTEAELNRLSNAWERLKKSASRPAASAATTAAGVATDVLNRVADNWEAGERKILENRLTQLQAELSTALDKRAELEADLERYRSGAGGVFAKRNAANTERQIATTTSDIAAILDQLGALARQLPIVEDGWAEMWGVAEAGGRSAADELRGPLEAAAEAAGLVVTKNGLLTQSEQELATHTGTLTKVLALAPAELKKLGLSAADVAVIMAQLQEKLDPIAATIMRMNTAAATLAVAPKFRSLYETLDQGEKDKGRPLTDNEAADLTKAWSTKRKADSAEQVRLTREAADAAVRLGQAQVSGNPAAVAQAKAQADVAKALRDGTVTQSDKAAYYQSRLREEMAGVNGQAGATATGLSVQARQARELAAATREGGAAAWEAATRHKVENETRQAGAGLSSELAARVRDEAEAQRELAQAQWDRDLDTQIAAAQALAAAEVQGADAVAAATIATQAAAQAEKEGVAADSARAKAITEKTRALAEWQQRQGAAAAGRQADDDLTLLQAEIRLQGEGASVRERTLYLLKEEQAIRREFPLLSEDERDELLKKKALLYDTGASLKEQQALYEEIGNGLGQAFDRVGAAVTEAFAKGETAALDFAALGRATMSELIQLALRLAVINPLKNWISGGAAPTLWSALSGDSGASAGTAATQGNGVTGTLSNAAMSKAGGWALDRMGITGSLTNSLDAWGYSTLGIGTALTTNSTMMTAASGGLAQSLGVAPVAGGVSNAAAAGSTTATGMSGVSGGLSAYLAAAGAGAFGGGLLGGWAGTAAQSKAVGAGVGAVAGAGSAYLASIMGMSSIGGPIGLAIGAIVGGIMGAIGTQKTPAGPGSSIDLSFDAAGQSYARDVQTRKGGDATAVTQTADALELVLRQMAAAGGAVGAGVRVHVGENQRDGWDTIYDGRVVTNSRDPNEIIRTVVREMMAGGMLSFAPGSLAGRAAAASVAMGSDAETLANDVALAAGIEAGTTALKDYDASVAAVTKSAKAAVIDGLAPLQEELDRAVKLGIGDEYTTLVSGQLRQKFEQIINPVDISATEQAVASLRGEMAGWRQASDDMGLGLRDLIDQAEETAVGRARTARADELTRATREAAGKGYLNTAADITSEYAAVTRELTALGMDTAQAGALSAARLQSLLDGLDSTQAAEVVAALTGSLADLARGALATKTAAEAAATAQADAATAAQTAAARRQGQWALQQALDPSWAVGPRGALRGAGIDPDAFPVLTQEMGGFLAAAKTGAATVSDLTTVHAALTARLDSGRLTAEQYTAAVDAIGGAWERSSGVAAARRQGQWSLSQAIDPSWTMGPRATLRSAGIDADAFPVLTQEVGGFLSLARTGTATVSDLTTVHAALTARLDSGRLTAEQYTAAVDAVGTAWERSTAAAQARASVAWRLGVAANDNLTPGPNRILRAAGIDPSSFPVLVTELGQFTTLARSGSATLSDLSTAYAAVTARLDSGRLTAQQYTAALDQLDSLWQQQSQAAATLADSLRTTAKSLRDAAAGMRTDDQSSSGAATKLADAQTRYESLLTKARTGDAQAMADVVGAAQTYRQLAQAWHYDQAAYRAIDTGVIADLKGLATLADSRAASTDPLLAASERQVDLLEDVVAALQGTAWRGPASATAINAQWSSVPLDRQLAGRDGGTFTHAQRIAVMVGLGYTGDVGGGAFDQWLDAEGWRRGAANTLSERLFGLRPYATGGIVSGGVPGLDSVPAMLMPGEAVLTTLATRRLGGGAITAINSGAPVIDLMPVVSGLGTVTRTIEASGAAMVRAIERQTQATLAALQEIDGRLAEMAAEQQYQRRQMDVLMTRRAA